MSSTQDQPSAGAGTGGQATQPSAPSGETAKQYVPRPSPQYDDAGARTEPSGAVLGLTMAAAVLMMVSGIWNFLEGLAAIIRGSYFIVLPNYAFDISVTSWGWIHLILGIVVAAAGACLFMDMLWARITGVVLASASAIANFLYIPYLPVWSVAVIALDVFVIWALLSPRRGFR